MTTTKMLQRLATLFVLCLAVLSIGADTSGCGDPQSNQPSALDCCPAGTQRYVCGVQVALNAVELMGEGNPPKTDTRCFAAPPICATGLIQAQNQATGYAQLQYGNGMQTVTMQTITCRVVGGGCGDGGLTVQDFEGACTFVETNGAGGSSTVTTSNSSSSTSSSGSTSCLADTDLCSSNTDCCSGICSESGTCEPCRMMGEGCVSNNECCSAICSLNACGG